VPANIDLPPQMRINGMRAISLHAADFAGFPAGSTGSFCG
jgi:hypothetical protein